MLGSEHRSALDNLVVHLFFVVIVAGTARVSACYVFFAACSHLEIRLAGCQRCVGVGVVGASALCCWGSCTAWPPSLLAWLAP